MKLNDTARKRAAQIHQEFLGMGVQHVLIENCSMYRIKTLRQYVREVDPTCKVVTVRGQGYITKGENA